MKKAEEKPGHRVSVPAQHDEEDIVEEAGGEIDEETGELVVDENKVRELGAVDAETIRENRRIGAVVHKQKTGQKGVAFDTDDPLAKYDGLLKTWGPNSLYIRVKRLTGAQVVKIIRSCPRSGDELYTALMVEHGQHPEAEYELKFQSTDGHKWRGTGRITLPETRPYAQQGQPMFFHNQNGGPPHTAPAPGWPAQQPPVPAAQSSIDPMSMMTQMFELFQRMQQPAQPQMPVMPPMPPQSDPGAQMAWMQQMFELFQRTQKGAVQQAAPPPQAPAPAAPDPLAQMRLFIELFREMQALQPPPPRAQPAQGPMHRFDPNERRPPYTNGSPVQRPLSAAEQFRETMATMSTMRNAYEEMESFFGGREERGGYAPPSPNEDSPVRVEEIGKIKTIRNNDAQGEMRVWETIIANAPNGVKWFIEQVDKVNKEKQQREQPPARVLPNGYVEVGPDYRPPPGFVAVQVDPASVPLPPPPVNMPPPIQSEPSPKGWVIPGSEEE